MIVRISVPVSLAEAGQINSKLDRLRTDTRKKLDATEKRLKAGDPKVMEERSMLIYSLNRLTQPNLTRVIMSLGMKALTKLPDTEIVEQIAATGVVRGRKKNAA